MWFSGVLISMCGSYIYLPWNYTLLKFLLKKEDNNKNRKTVRNNSNCHLFEGSNTCWWPCIVHRISSSYPTFARQKENSIRGEHKTTDLYLRQERITSDNALIMKALSWELRAAGDDRPRVFPSKQGWAEWCLEGMRRTRLWWGLSLALPPLNNNFECLVFFSLGPLACQPLLLKWQKIEVLSP